MAPVTAGVFPGRTACPAIRTSFLKFTSIIRLPSSHRLISAVVVAVVSNSSNSRQSTRGPSARILAMRSGQ